MSGNQIKLSEKEEKREIEILRELQAMSTRWFSEEEFQRLGELVRKYNKPEGKYNDNRKLN